MEKTALAQEKVWFDKSSYDKAERLYFERMAKVLRQKMMKSSSLNNIQLPMPGNRADFVSNNYLSESNSGKFYNDEPVIIEKKEAYGGAVSKDSNRINENFKSCNKVQRDKNVLKKQTNGEKEADEENEEEEEEEEEAEEEEEEKKKKKKKHAVGTGAGIIEEGEPNLFNDSSSKRNTKKARKKRSKIDGRSNREANKEDTKDTNDNVASVLRSKDPLKSNQVQGHQENSCPFTLPAGGSLANEIGKARQHIKQSLQCMDNIAAAAGVSTQPVLREVAIQRLEDVIQKLQERVTALEERCNMFCPAVAPGCTANLAVCPAKPAEVPNESSAKDEKPVDDDVDLFGSDSEGEDTEAARIREERLAAYAAKKAKKPVLIAKSNIILDVKPWDDETDMKEMEKEVRKIETDGLLWGAAKLVPLAFGIHKLQISCVVEDDKVSIDWLTEKIQEIEDFVQSVDIAAFNKV